MDNPREALTIIEYQVQDDYSVAPELEDAVAILYSVVEQEQLLWEALQQLEQASTDFVLSVFPLLISLPKETFEELIPALTAARALLGKEGESEVSNDHG